MNHVSCSTNLVFSDTFLFFPKLIFTHHRYLNVLLNSLAPALYWIHSSFLSALTTSPATFHQISINLCVFYICVFIHCNRVISCNFPNLSCRFFTFRSTMPTVKKTCLGVSGSPSFTEFRGSGSPTVHRAYQGYWHLCMEQNINICQIICNFGML